jgi:hypothetical protein
MGIPTQNEEMIGARDFAREYPKQMKRLASGEIEKLVITSHGKLQAVVLTVEDYEKLLDAPPRRKRR